MKNKILHITQLTEFERRTIACAISSAIAEDEKRHPNNWHFTSVEIAVLEDFYKILGRQGENT